MSEEAAKSQPKKRKAENKLQTCPYCDYQCKRASVMSRHMNSKHADLNKNPSSALLKVIEGKESVPEMLRAVACWLDDASSLEGRLPVEMIDWLKREDAKIQLALRVIAIGKVRRALGLVDKLAELDKLFGEKLDKKGEGSWREQANPERIAEMIDNISSSIERDLRFLKEIATLGQVNVGDVIDKLVTAFGSTVKGGNISALQVTGVSLPSDPAQRENLRTLVAKLGLGNIPEPVYDDDRQPSGTVGELAAGAESKSRKDNPAHS